MGIVFLKIVPSVSRSVQWTTDEDLDKLLSEHGRVTRTRFFDDKINTKSKGYLFAQQFVHVSHGWSLLFRVAVVEFEDPQSAGKAYLSSQAGLYVSRSVPFICISVEVLRERKRLLYGSLYLRVQIPFHSPFGIFSPLSPQSHIRSTLFAFSRSDNCQHSERTPHLSPSAQPVGAGRRASARHGRPTISHCGRPFLHTNGSAWPGRRTAAASAVYLSRTAAATTAAIPTTAATAAVSATTAVSAAGISTAAAAISWARRLQRRARRLPYVHFSGVHMQFVLYAVWSFCVSIFRV